MAKRVTIYDIAEAAGVSTSTVSRALSSSPLIGDEVIAEVRAVAEQLGYRQRRIKRQAERAILQVRLILPRLDQAYQHQFFDVLQLAEGIRAGAAPTRVHVVIEAMVKDFAVLPHKKGGAIDGIIFAFTKPSSAILSACEQYDIPVLTLNRIMKNSHFITADNRGDAARLVHSVADLQATMRPCFVGPTGLDEVVRERRSGIAAACKKGGIIFSQKDEFRVRDPAEVNKEMVSSWYTSGYNTVFAFNDLMAIAVVQSALASGLNVPRDLAVIGYDDAPVRSLVRPKLTTMSMPVATIAQRAGEWIQAVIVNREPTRWQEYVQGDFCPGETTGRAS